MFSLEITEKSVFNSYSWNIWWIKTYPKGYISQNKRSYLLICGLSVKVKNIWEIIFFCLISWLKWIEAYINYALFFCSFRLGKVFSNIFILLYFVNYSIWLFEVFFYTSKLWVCHREGRKEVLVRIAMTKSTEILLKIICPPFCFVGSCDLQKKKKSGRQCGFKVDFKKQISQSKC